MTREDVISYIEGRKRELVEFCCSLIRIPSENPPGDVSSVAAAIEEWLEARGFSVDKHEPERGRVNLVAKIGAGKPVLVLDGHMDVVPAGDPSKWSFDPYCGEVRGGRILGRGSADVKGGLTSLIFAFDALSRIEEELSGTLVLAAVADEETGGSLGTGWLLERGILECDACLVAEPSGTAAAFLGEKGFCWLEVRARGAPAHASLPMLGENAIEKAARVIPVLKRVESMEVDVPEELEDVIASSGEVYAEMARERGASREAIEALAKVAGMYTVNIGIVRGGTKINVVPESCALQVDIRIPPGGSLKSVREIVRELLDRAGLKGLEVEFLAGSEPSYTPPKERICESLLESIRDVLKTEGRLLCITGFTDARFFRARGIPAVVYGPGELGAAHAYDEHVRIEDVVRATQVIACTALDYLTRQ